MFLLPLPLISASIFGAALGRMLAFVAMRIRRSDQGMAPSLSAGLRAQTVALHQRLAAVTRAFERVAALARVGRLRVYPDRKSPVPRGELTEGAPAAHRDRMPATSSVPPVSPFGEPTVVAQGPTLPPVPMRGFGWMLGFVPAEYRDAFAVFIADPEVVALIQASAAAARLLRPLCYGLGVVPAEGVFPRRRRKVRARRALAEAVPRSGRERRGEAGPLLRDLMMSAQARDRWWVNRYETVGGAVPAGGRPARR